MESLPDVFSGWELKQWNFCVTWVLRLLCESFLEVAPEKSCEIGRCFIGLDKIFYFKSIIYPFNERGPSV